MRGVLIQHPLEYRLEVPGDSFEQGAKIPCSLTIKNHGSTTAPSQQLTLELSLGTLKKVKAKESDAFESITRLDVPHSSELAPGAQQTVECAITLSPNAPVTDKHASLYLLYGDANNQSGCGQLLLTVHPHPHIRHIFDTMTTVCNFLNKGESHKNGRTIAKLKAPDSRRFSLVEELALAAWFEEDESLSLQFLFSVKKFDHSGSAVNVKKAKVEVTRRLAPSDYLFGGGFKRQEFIEEQIEVALSEVSSGL